MCVCVCAGLCLAESSRHRFRPNRIIGPSISVEGRATTATAGPGTRERDRETEREREREIQSSSGVGLSRRVFNAAAGPKAQGDPRETLTPTHHHPQLHPQLHPLPHHPPPHPIPLCDNQRPITREFRSPLLTQPTHTHTHTHTCTDTDTQPIGREAPSGGGDGRPLFTAVASFIHETANDSNQPSASMQTQNLVLSLSLSLLSLSLSLSFSLSVPFSSSTSCRYSRLVVGPK